jgi:3-deoxy-D-manno-octulosonic-acid transferase
MAIVANGRSRTAWGEPMRVLYTLLLALVAPVAFVWLAFRSRRQTGAPDAWRERLGSVSATDDRQPILIHAASLGEAQAARGLIEALLARGEPLLITTFSATARRHCAERYGKRATVATLPYDLPKCVGRFLRTARPRGAIFIETEIWPNLYRALERRGTPMMIASARLSDKAFASYRRFGGLVGNSLARVARVGAQTREDADRFVALGAPAERVSVIGNLKFDARLPADTIARGQALRRTLFGARPVWVAGSTRPGEEETLLSAFGRVREAVPDCALVLAPRHPERAAMVAALAKTAGVEAVFRSDHGDSACTAPVLIIDAVGELLDFYAAADVATVGGTFAAIGGHNILEPAMLAKPIVSGPYLDNWRGLAETMTRDGALTIATTVADLAGAVGHLLLDTSERARAGQAALAHVERHRGALQCVLNWLDDGRIRNRPVSRSLSD